MSYEIGVAADVTSEKLLREVAAGDGRIDIARASVGASVLQQLGHQPD